MMSFTPKRTLDDDGSNNGFASHKDVDIPLWTNHQKNNNSDLEIKQATYTQYLHKPGQIFDFGSRVSNDTIGHSPPPNVSKRTMADSYNTHDKPRVNEKILVEQRHLRCSRKWVKTTGWPCSTENGTRGFWRNRSDSFKPDKIHLTPNQKRNKTWRSIREAFQSSLTIIPVK